MSAPESPTIFFGTRTRQQDLGTLEITRNSVTGDIEFTVREDSECNLIARGAFRELFELILLGKLYKEQLEAQAKQPVTISNLERARAMKCFGKLAEMVELDPDPKAQDKLQEEFNCKNCDSYPYCCQIADTLDNKAKQPIAAKCDICDSPAVWFESPLGNPDEPKMCDKCYREHIEPGARDWDAHYIPLKKIV